MAVATKIASTCRDAVAASAISQDAVAQLQSAGVPVSDIHNAELTVDVDCLPLARPHGASSAVHQCLGFSEMVAPASNGGRAMLATTWRQCQSYTCSRANCESLLRPGLRTLVDAFLVDSQQRGLSLAAHAAPAAPLSVSINPIERASQRVGGPVIFYSLYLLMCFLVLLYWQMRREAGFRCR
jgi:hypothetical protein